MTERTEGTETAEARALATTWDRIFDWTRRLGVRPTQIGLGCCAIGMTPALDPRHDLSRFGVDVFRTAPRRGDLLIVAGTVSRKMAPLLRRLWDEMPEPRWALALGSCASGGGPYRTYAVLRGIGQVIPIDVHVPGCPPRPEALLAGLRELETRMGLPEVHA
ncbi:MAG TPA: NADH-quinone oxidoreductase subunit NuoB [Thermoanaerobaculia bacterium]|jgi:NADH-quinone oxidoreductase subunit B|nr:NADH-quinone oxidoreductase subunit NuoB [Thermoanaerobaculia bacterium]